MFVGIAGEVGFKESLKGDNVVALSLPTWIAFRAYGMMVPVYKCDKWTIKGSFVEGLESEG